MVVKKQIFFLFVFSILFAFPKIVNAGAVCGGSVASSCDAIGTVQAAVIALESTAKVAVKNVAASIKQLDMEVRRKIGKVEDAIVQEATKLSSTVTSAATNEIIARQKNLQSFSDQKSVRMQRLAKAEISERVTPTASDCLVLTDKRNQAGEKIMLKGVGNAIVENQINRRNNIEGRGDIARGAYEFQRLMQFCDPNMPNAPEGCAQTDTANTHLDTSFFMGNTTIKDPAALEIQMDAFNSITGDTMALPTYSTAPGQRAYVDEQARRSYQMVVDNILGKIAALRLPTSNTGGDQLATWNYILGDDAPAQLSEFYQQNQSPQVSEASKRDVERQAMVSFQTSIDNIALSKEGGSDRKVIADLARLIEMEYQSYLEAQKKNILLALQLAGKN